MKTKISMTLISTILVLFTFHFHYLLLACSISPCYHRISHEIPCKIPIQEEKNLYVSFSRSLNFSTNQFCLKVWHLKNFHKKMVVLFNLLWLKPLKLRIIVLCITVHQWRLNLTHLFPMHPFSTPWKHQKISRFPDVFMG